MITAAFLIEIGIKSAVVAGATLGVLRLARSRSAAERSWIGHAGLIALILIVPAALLMPGWNPLPQPAASAIAAVQPQIVLPELALAQPPGHAPASALPAQIASFALPSAGELAVWLYAIPLALLILAMGVAVIRLSAVHRRSNLLVDAGWLSALALAQQRMGFKHGTALLVSDELRSPVSWGMMRPIIVLNRDAVSAVAEAEPIIAHELAHVARLDWAKLLIARLACALFWFNPLVWLLARECHQLREEAADDAVLLSDVDGADYASLLVSAARHDNAALLLAAHGVAPARNSLKRRITRVLDARLSRGPANGAWMALCVVVLIGVAGPLAAFDPLVASTTSEAGAAKQTGLVQQVIAAAVPNAVHAAMEQAHAFASDGGDSTGDEPSSDSAADRLIALRASGVTEEYVQQMRAAFPTASLDDLTGAKAVGVTPEFAAEMRRLGADIDLDTVVAARATGMSADYLAEMRNAFPRLSVEDAVGMRAVGVDADYASEMRQLFPGVSADQVQGMRAMNVTPDFVRTMRREGLSARDPDEVIEGRQFAQTLVKTRDRRGRSVVVGVGPNGPRVKIHDPDGDDVSVEVPTPPIPPNAP